MSFPSTHQAKPKGLLRLLYKMPTYIYRLHLGRLLRHRFLMLIHQGRRTGRIRRTVLEVIRYDPILRQSIVISAYGANSDWYQNIRAKPAIEIQTGEERYTPTQRFLTPDEVYAELIEYEHRHPSTFRNLLRLLGRQYDGSDAGRRLLAESFRMVAFHSKDPPKRLMQKV